MKIHFGVLIFLAILSLVACNNMDEKPVGQASKDSLTDYDTIDLRGASVKSDDYFENLESTLDTLAGCWAAIREGNITISFSKDSTFEFYDYNSKLKEIELLTGRYELNKNILTLFYQDRPKQRFTFKRDPESNNEYRITNTAGYYFVKSNCQ
ncbi:hypothetical protein [Terrimonas pollutisoli]|uniref:hypothetical protein n=1 Tax=Terrimonas pollutisoli TaxID=3034147 RepID=UPI0023ED5BB1|nr:hypothetical protein [Terrimonas sp. H1YJ31]